jgi:hypothetical protein
MKRQVFARWLAAPLWLTFSLPAQVTNVSVAGVTNTQAVLQYTAPNTSACTVEVSNSPSYVPLVHDVDAAIFAGSNLDNRPGSISGNVTRTFVVGTRDAEQGLNGHWYSRALQALTPHYYRITCGTYTATGSFTTSNIALGNTYNETLPPAPNVTSNGIYSYTGQYAWPEFLNWNAADPAARRETVIDPQTGMALKRMTMPQDWGSYADHSFKAATTATGGWTNPNSVLADDSSSATYSGASSDWLAIADSSLNFNGGELESLTFSTKAWCSGTCAGDDAKIQLCLTVNGVSCWPTAANVYEIALGTTSQPSALVSFGGGSLSMFPWTPPGIPPLVSWEVMQRTGAVNVDVSGKVTWAGSGNQFYPGWTAGSKIVVAGSSCAIAGVTNPQALTITPESCSPALTLPQSSASYSAGNFGVMIRKKTASLDTINVQYVKYTLGGTAQLQWPSGGGTKLCARTETQNSVTGHMGYHCVVGNTPQVYWIDSTTGDANWLGPLYTGNHSAPDAWANQGCNNASVTLTGAGSTNPEKYYCPTVDENSKPVILGCTFTTTNQTGSASSNCQNLTPGSAGKDVLSLIASFTSGYSPSFDPTQFNGIGIVATQNGQILVTSARSYQDTAAWMVVFNPTMVGTDPGCVGGGKPGCVVAAVNTWSPAVCRWCTLHSTGYAGETNSWIVAGKYFGGFLGVPGGGFYTSTVSSAMTATPSIAAGTAGCPAGSKGCDLVTVDGEPCNMAPAGVVGGHAGDPLNCPKNAAWSYLQDAAPGDVLGTAAGPLEYMKLISKNGNQWLVQRGLGWPGLVNPSTPVQLVEECLARDDGFTVGVSTLQWIWDFANDPHGLNASGTTLKVQYPYDHQAAGENFVVGGAPWYDPNNHGLGYAVLDGPGYLYPNKYGQMGPAFSGALGITPYNEVAQNHPSHPQYNAPAGEQTWFLDARPLSGPGPTLVDRAFPVSGQLYKFSSTTSDGDNLKFVGGAVAQLSAVNRKLQPTMMFCGTQPMIDISSAAQGNAIGTGAANSYQYCVARKSGECRTGSSSGEVYANCPFANPRYNYSGTYGCNNIFNENGLGNDLCINNTGAYLNGIAQIGYQNAYDSAGLAGRMLTHGMIRYRINDVNENARTTPDGSWLLFEAYAFNGSEYQILTGKMLPYPPVDSFNRTTFVPLSLQFKPPDGLAVNNAIVQFGYAENGAASQLYCTSRHEPCFAASATVGSVPFQFPSDGSDGTAGGLAGAACSAGCTVAIPALSQRVVYYRVQYRDSGNRVIAQTPLQAVSTP